MYATTLYLVNPGALLQAPGMTLMTSSGLLHHDCCLYWYQDGTRVEGSFESL